MESYNTKVSSENNIMDHIFEFSIHGESYLKSLSKNDLIEMIECAKMHYYEKSTPLLFDGAYDILESYIDNMYPDLKITEKVGIQPTNKNKIILPYEMWGMNKYKTEKEVEKWKSKYNTGNYVFSMKLDGVSGMYMNNMLCTRGDSTTGTNISYLLNVLHLPALPYGMAVRGELILSKYTFHTEYPTSKNQLSVVAGLIGRQKITDKHNKIEFIAYEIIHPEYTPEKQFEMLEQLGFNVAPHVVYNANNEETFISSLSNNLLYWRKNGLYDTDGVVIKHNAIYPRKSENPKHAFAFKMVVDDQIGETIVKEVEWNASKDGVLVPKIILQPIKIKKMVSQVSGYNADFIVKQGIGVGAVVEIIHSGDVIFNVHRVIKPVAPQLPTNVNFVWGATKKHIILENPHNSKSVLVKQIYRFFKKIGAAKLAEGNIQKLVDSHYDSIPKIINMTTQDFLQVDGFQEKMSTTLFNSVQTSLANADIVSLMDASNIFSKCGYGEKKLRGIIDFMPQILTSTSPHHVVSQQIYTNLSGFSESSANMFVSLIPQFKVFVNDIGMTHLLSPAQITNSSNTSTTHKKVTFSENVVFTGGKPKNLETQAKKYFTISDRINKETKCLVCKDPASNTEKTKKAKSMNIPIYGHEEFQKYITSL